MSDSTQDPVVYSPSDAAIASPVLIVGGGITGLNCASHLQKQGIPFRLLEASDGLGGRMRTDAVDGFLLDRGFQVFQTAYPEAKAAIDYSELDLASLVPGALVRKNAHWIPMVAPLRHPRFAIGTLFNRIGNIADRFRLAKLLLDVRSTPLERLTEPGEDKETRELLTTDYGFSNSLVENFFRPWLAGIFLESNLVTSARFFRFVLKMLASGRVAYPRKGIQAIPAALAQRIPPEAISLNCPVLSMHRERVSTSEMEFETGHVVLAVAMHQANSLLQKPPSSRSSVATTCVYFVADRPPRQEPILLLNGEGEGPVNHVFVMTNASRDLAPPGKALVSVSLVGQSRYDPSEILSQMTSWFGPQVKDWRELAAYEIEHALPEQPAGFTSDDAIFESEGIVVCGDYCSSASLQGAMRSGRKAAERIASRLRKEG